MDKNYDFLCAFTSNIEITFTFNAKLIIIFWIKKAISLRDNNTVQIWSIIKCGYESQPSSRSYYITNPNQMANFNIKVPTNKHNRSLCKILYKHYAIKGYGFKNGAHLDHIHTVNHDDGVRMNQDRLQF